MDDSNLQLALRQWKSHMVHPITQVVLFGVSLILGLSGPFGTSDLLPPVQNFFYWALVAVPGYGGGAFISALLQRVLTRLGNLMAIIVIGVIIGFYITGLVLMWNVLFFGWAPHLFSMTSLFPTILAISICVTWIVTTANAYWQREIEQGADMGPTPVPVKILNRIAPEKRGDLVALSVQDHYVHVKTTIGDDMVLMRLSDAIGETGDIRGDQVHRSHWVAYDHVTDVRREVGKAVLTLSTGDEIPVSRANLNKLKEAGLLP